VVRDREGVEGEAVLKYSIKYAEKKMTPKRVMVVKPMKHEFLAVISAVILGILVMYVPMQILTVPQQPSYATMEGRDTKTAPEVGGERSKPVVIEGLIKAGLVFFIGLIVAFGVMLYIKRKMDINP